MTSHDGSFDGKAATMGFFDSIKKAFDAGGIKVEVDAPGTFRWSEGTLPVTVAITGHGTEERTITSIEIELEPEPQGTTAERTRARKRGRGITQRHGHPLVVAPGETVAVELVFALDPAAAIEGASGEEAPGWLKAVGTAANVVSDVTRQTPWYRLTATPEVEGFTARKSASRRIRNLRAGEWGVSIGG